MSSELLSLSFVIIEDIYIEIFKHNTILRENLTNFPPLDFFLVAYSRTFSTNNCWMGSAATFCCSATADRVRCLRELKRTKETTARRSDIVETESEKDIRIPNFGRKMVATVCEMETNRRREP